MNKNRVAQLRDQLAGLSPDDDMYDVLLEEIKMLQGQGMYSKPKKKFKEGKKVRGMGIARKGTRACKMR